MGCKYTLSSGLFIYFVKWVVNIFCQVGSLYTLSSGLFIYFVKWVVYILCQAGCLYTYVHSDHDSHPVEQAIAVVVAEDLDMFHPDRLMALKLFEL